MMNLRARWLLHCCALCLTLCFASCSDATTASQTQSAPPEEENVPVILFTDLTSGPKNGWDGESNKGAAVTVWGKNFSEVRGESHVTINGAQLVSDDDYAEWNVPGPVQGLRRITFWLNEACDDGAGELTVTVAGRTSNSLPFTVRPGRIFFIDKTPPKKSGSGTLEKPWRNPREYYKKSRPGDIGYFREGTYSDRYGYHKGGGNVVINVDRGAGGCRSGTVDQPIAYVAYPGETAVMDATDPEGPTTNFRAYSPSGAPAHFVIAKFTLRALGKCVGTGTGAGWRIVGNDCMGLTTDKAQRVGTIGTVAKSAKILGNTVHGGRTGSKFDHAIYPSGCPSEGGVEVAWNHIYDNDFDRGPMISVNHEGRRCAADEYVDDGAIHDNIVDCTNYASRAIGVYDLSYREGDPKVPAQHVYNNLIIRCGSPKWGALYHQSGSAYFHGNTLFDTRTIGFQVIGPSTVTTEIKDNIIHMNESAAHYIHTRSDPSGSLIVQRNRYEGLEGSPEIDSDPVRGGVAFVDPEAGDFRLRAE